MGKGELPIFLVLENRQLIYMAGGRGWRIIKDQNEKIEHVK